MKTGTIFKIQKYSIHDGPGIRTSVFLKGCPLNCWWCHNPEGQEPSGLIVYHKDKCLHCGRCGGRFRCAEVCPGDALEQIGREMTVAQVMDILVKDIPFYDESGGGVTFTGGEPFLQYAFLRECLKACRELDIHTAVETSGYTSWERLKEASRLTDLFLYDVKLMDEEKHRAYTGVSNKPILENLERLARNHPDICVRIPIIPGINDDAGNIGQTCTFLKAINIHRVNILPYHAAGAYKYESLGLTYKLKHTGAPGEQEIQRIEEIFRTNGFSIKIGG